uniref:Thioredoxin-like fold domain-containing protein n=1 Tax=Strongyloides stercoralis TaxID=6248 RepID=A0A0K0DW49_STRER
MNEIKSIGELEKEVYLNPFEIFNHKRILGEEIERFKENFINNERPVEFGALIKLNHKILEALDTDIQSLFEKSNIKSITSNIEKLTERLSHLCRKQFSAEELSLFDPKTLKPSSIALIADEKLLDLIESEKAVKANEESLFSTTIIEEVNEEENKEF